MDTISRRVRLIGIVRNERGEKDYVNHVMDLSDDIAAELKRQKSLISTHNSANASTATLAAQETADSFWAVANAPSGPAAEPDQPSVYLAEVSSDLADLRDEVKRFLIQAEYRVLPAKRFPGDVEGFENAVRVALDRSAVFVQLLSDDPGPNVNGTDHRLVAAQHDLAARMSKPALIWRSRTLDPGKVNDVAHRELLENPNVMALEIQELKPHNRRARKGGAHARAGAERPRTKWVLHHC